MAEKIKLIDEAMQTAITNKRNFASNMLAELERHKGEVNSYNTFWLGLAHERFEQRYGERHTVYVKELVDCLNDQADDMHRILTEKQALDSTLAGTLS